ncbi:hypothetical protein O181_056199 [Austropuccinia psidii MF-1]|uniref:Uncharacterized protein n=1 Tax=Austropuccinia psidii MF-1 TaxID=1389203 RepID=A0A9Q3E843_9BASI|nr:hypothetical protein [Austropuccinia psidii MF-1]
MMSKMTSICDSNHSDYPPSVLYGPGVFDNLRDLSGKSMAPTAIHDINKTYDGHKSVRVIKPPCSIVRRGGFLVLNLLLLGPPGPNSATLEREMFLRPTIGLQKIPEDHGAASRRLEVTGSRMRSVQKRNNTNSFWANIGGPIHPQVTPIRVAPEVPILVNRKIEDLEN